MKQNNPSNMASRFFQSESNWKSFWSLQGRNAHGQIRQYNTVATLNWAIMEQWQHICTTYLNSLTVSSPWQCIEVIHTNGEKINSSRFTMKNIFALRGRGRCMGHWKKRASRDIGFFCHVNICLVCNRVKSASICFLLKVFFWYFVGMFCETWCLQPTKVLEYTTDGKFNVPLTKVQWRK